MQSMMSGSRVKINNSQPAAALRGIGLVTCLQLSFLTCLTLFLLPLFSARPSLTCGLQFSRDITALVRRETELTNLFLSLYPHPHLVSLFSPLFSSCEECSFFIEAQDRYQLYRSVNLLINLFSREKPTL